MCNLHLLSQTSHTHPDNINRGTGPAVSDDPPLRGRFPWDHSDGRCWFFREGLQVLVSINISSAVQTWAADTHPCVRGGGSHAQRDHIVTECYTSALNMGSVQLCIPSLLSRAFPEPRAAGPQHHHGITTPTARTWMAAPSAKGSMLTASFLQWDSMALGGERYFFSPTTLHGPEGAVSRPIHELLGSSNPNRGFGAFPLKTTFVVRMYMKALSKKFHLTAASLHWRRCPQAC